MDNMEIDFKDKSSSGFTDFISQNFYGFDVVLVPFMVDIVQVKRHRKKRINKKWRKRYGFKAVHWRKVIVDKKNRRLLMHPKVWEILLPQVESYDVRRE